MNKHIDSEIIMQRKINSFVYVYIMIIIILVLSLIIFFMLFNYKTYYKTKGIVTEENDYYYIKTYIPLNNIKYLTNNNIVIIDKNKYKYSIKNIDKEYYTDNQNTYQIITIDLDLPSKYQYNNLTIELKLKKEEKKIIDYILRKEKNNERTK